MKAYELLTDLKKHMGRDWSPVNVPYHINQVEEALRELEELRGEIEVECVEHLRIQQNTEVVFVTRIEDLQSQLEALRKRDKLSMSVIPCSMLDGDCCGCLYMTDDGNIRCNECGDLFDIVRA